MVRLYCIPFACLLLVACSQPSVQRAESAGTKTQDQVSNSDQTSPRIDQLWFLRVDATEYSEYERGESYFKTSENRQMTREQAFSCLLGTNRFAGSAIGDGGDLSRQVAAYRVILRQPDAGHALKHLLICGKSAGQLYALCGLYSVDQLAFLQAIRDFRDMPGNVRTQFGCIGLYEPIAPLVESHDPCVVRLKPGQSPRAWLAESGCKDYVMDIVGGGFSWEFSERPTGN